MLISFLVLFVQYRACNNLMNGWMDYIDINDYGKKKEIRNFGIISHIGAEIKF